METSGIPKALKPKRSFSPIWLTPLLALLITLYLLYSGFVNSGKTITIEFDSAADLVAEKTLVKYRGITVGKVKDVVIGDNPEKVEAVVTLSKDAKRLAKQGMMFWIVKPRLGFNKITGLETLLSGAYIEVQPPTYDIDELKDLPDQNFFIGINEPPDIALGDDSLLLNLRTSENLYLIKGVPIFYKGLNAGYVINARFNPEISLYEIGIAVSKEYEQYLSTATTFWEVGGLDISYDAAGFSMEAAPLAGLISGGIAFDTPAGVKGGKITDGHVFPLYGSEKYTLLSDKTITLRMADSGGIKAGRTPIIYKGLPAGLVTGVTQEADGITAQIRLNREIESAAGEKTRFVLVRPKFSLTEVSGLSTILTGTYIELFPQAGEPAYEFTLSDYPPEKGEADGIAVKLTADAKGSLEERSGIFFKNIQIGHITGISLTPRHKVEFDAVIYADYKTLTDEGLYFSRNEGLNIRLGSGGVELGTQSLATLIKGGITAEHYGKSGSKKIYALYGNKDESRNAFYAETGIKTVQAVTDTAEGLSEGDPVTYKGIQVGETGKPALQPTGEIATAVLIYPEYANLLTPASVFYKSGGISFQADARGLRIEAPSLKSAATGGISFFNPEKPVSMAENGVYKLYPDKSAADNALLVNGKGLKVTLTADNTLLPSAGAAVYYKNLRAGSVLSAQIGANGKPEVKLLINEEYGRFVSEKTRYWLEGGIELRADSAGVSLLTKPLKTYFESAVYFDSFPSAVAEAVLYPDAASAREADMREVTITFPYPADIKAGAPIEAGGIETAYVKSARITPQATIVTALANPAFSGYFSEGALFWTEDFSISLDGIENIDSVLRGAKIAMTKGNGNETGSFTAQKAAPSPYEGLKGLRVTLLSPARHSLEVGSPVFYRQIETGGVESIRLSPDGRNVEIAVFIEEKYRNLVREGTVFWNSGGVGTKINLFGVKVKTESMKTLLIGGISFATRDSDCPQAEDGHRFDLHADPKSGWLKWSPELAVGE